MDAREELIGQFANALDRGERPEISNYLPAQADDRRPVLVALVQVELGHFIRSGRETRAESYLELYPELADDPDTAVDVIVAEFEYRRQLEPELSPDSYLARFPSYASLLSERLGATVALRGLTDFHWERPPESGKAPGDTPRDSRRPHSSQASDPLKRLGITQVRDYRIVERIGGGGMGIVYRAVHQRLNKTVAIKVLSPQLTDEPQAVSRFEREMQAVGALDHPNIVRATDAGEIDGRHYLVMEFIEGATFSELSRRLGTLPVADACELVRQAAEALEHVRRAGLVHRDVKPSNLMLTRDGQVKLLDLGLARLQVVAGEWDPLTSSGQIMGTFDYIAPEQIDHVHEVDIRADIYSLGCTLYKLLCRRPPFDEARYDSTARKLHAVLNEPAPPIQQRRPDIPPELSTIVGRMMAKRPADRFQTPGEVAAALASQARDCNLADLLERVEREKTKPETDVSSESTLEFLNSGATEPQPGTESATKWWLRPLERYPLCGTVLVALLPNAMLSVFNVAYDWSVIVSRLDAEVQALFVQMLILMKGVLYIGGTAIGVAWALPIFLAMRNALAANQQDVALRRCLRLGDLVFWITVTAWGVSGVVFPAWLGFWAGPLEPRHYFHFLAAHILCGLIAGTLAYFLMTWLGVHVVAPKLLPASTAGPAVVDWLLALRRHVEGYTRLMVAVPFAAALSLGFSGIEYRLAFIELALLGGGVLLIGSRVNGDIRRDIDALAASRR